MYVLNFAGVRDVAGLRRVRLWSSVFVALFDGTPSSLCKAGVVGSVLVFFFS